MSERLVLLLLEHAVVVTVFAASAFVTTRVIRSAPLAHLIWLLVLIKFITPSPVRIPLPDHASVIHVLDEANGSLGRGVHARSTDLPSVQPTTFDSTQSASEPLWPICLVAVWLAGSCAIAAVLAVRVNRFRRLLRRTTQTSAELEAEFALTIRAAGLAAGPAILLTTSKVGPCLAAVGVRPVMLVPKLLLNSLSGGERQTLLAHELAHFRRRDHWLVWLDVFVVSIFWWHPVAWGVRRARRLAAEECCDGYVMRWFPDKSKVYAGTLLKTLDFTAGGGSSLPAFANAMGQFRHFKRRFEMILNGKTRHSIHRVGILIALPCVAAFLCTPAIFAQAESEPEMPANRREAPPRGFTIHEQAESEPQAKQAVAESEEAPEDKLVFRVYKIADLPVWSKDGTFDSTLLIYMLQSSIAPESWDGLGGTSFVAPDEKSASLVISTTDTNHKAIAEKLQQLRRSVMRR